METIINGVSIKLTPDQIQKVLASQNLKTKEERFKELIEGIQINRPMVNFEGYPTSLLWFKDNVLCFEYSWKTQNFWVSWSPIWSVFEEEFYMEYEDIKSFMKIMAEKHFKLKGVTPYLR